MFVSFDTNFQMMNEALSFLLFAIRYSVLFQIGKMTFRSSKTPNDTRNKHNCWCTARVFEILAHLCKIYLNSHKY